MFKVIYFSVVLALTLAAFTNIHAQSVEVNQSTHALEARAWKWLAT